MAFRHGTIPKAVYTFKHALVQNAAYSTLLRERRQQLHARIASVLKRNFRTQRRHSPNYLRIIARRQASLRPRLTTVTAAARDQTLGDDRSGCPL